MRIKQFVEEVIDKEITRLNDVIRSDVSQAPEIGIQIAELGKIRADVLKWN